METWSQGLVLECQHGFAQHKAEQGIGSTYKNHTTSAQVTSTLASTLQECALPLRTVPRCIFFF